MLHLWYSSIYTEGLSPEARFPRDRYRLVRAGLEATRREGLVFFHEPDVISLDDIRLAHASGYVDRFVAGGLEDKEIRRIGLKPWTPLMVERTRILTHGTVLATRQVLEHGGIAGNVGGGTHHSYYDFGSGYCIFNDLAIAARVAQRDYDVGKILVLDLDVHQGDGTAAIFERDPTVRTVSVHCQENFPFRKMNSDVDVPIAKGTGDGAYLTNVERVIREQVEPWGPELILYQAGVDVLKTDRLGHLELTPAGVARRNELVFEMRRRLGDIPMVVTMGGGYGEPLETSCRAHVELFCQAMGNP